MCDHYFGRLLDYFDEHDLWSDTMLVLTTDHGFLLTEHDWWGKNRMPYYEEISHIPLMIHHPGRGEGPGRCAALTQTIDLMPTFLDVFGAPIPAEVRGRSLQPHLVPGSAARAGLVTRWRSGCSAGRSASPMAGMPITSTPMTCARPGSANTRLMPMHMDALFTGAEIETARMAGPFDFTKGMPLMRIDALADAKRIPVQDGQDFGDVGTALYDLRGRSRPAPAAARCRASSAGFAPVRRRCCARMMRPKSSTAVTASQTKRKPS